MALRLPHSAARSSRVWQASRGEREVFLGQAVAGVQRLVGDVGAGLAEQRREQAGRSTGISSSCGRPAISSTGMPSRSGRGRGSNGSMARIRIAPASSARLLQQQRPGDVGAVGIAERERLLKAVGLAGARAAKSASSAVRCLKIVDVPDAFAAAAEEARHAVLEDLAARRQDARGRARSAAASGTRSFSSPPVPCSSRSGGEAGVLGRNEAMDEAEIGRGHAALMPPTQTTKGAGWSPRPAMMSPMCAPRSSFGCGTMRM